MVAEEGPSRIELLAAVHELMGCLFSVVQKHDLWDEDGKYVLDDGTVITREQCERWQEEAAQVPTIQ